MTLPLGEFEGQLAQKICTQPCLGQWHRWARRPDLTAAPHGQRQLQTQRLIERQPAARLLLFGGVLRHVDLAQRLVEGHQTVLCQYRFRQRLGHRVQLGEHLVDAAVDIPALQVLGCRVDRKHIALEGRDGRGSIPGGPGDAAQRGASPRFGALPERGFQHQIVGVGQLGLAPKLPDSA
ncbi:Uncharacterised protein [Mycobacteroides abscessus subsp. massiliense]|nr:Uncharacterised protein [Mycobacteroides abscessus subsp. massiliense]